MIPNFKIESHDQACAFLGWCMGRIGEGFHPETNFVEYVGASWNRMFTFEQACELNACMSKVEQLIHVEPSDFCLEFMGANP